MDIFKEWQKNKFLVIAGPCAAESQFQLQRHFDSFPHSSYLRAGLYKLRTSAESFQGLREKGVELILKLKEQRDFAFVSEVVSTESLHLMAECTDIFQVGTRNMYNYELLKEIGKFDRPVILKRALSATLHEWLNACEYLKLPQEKIILCERGVRSFEPSYRNMLDINAVVYLKQNTSYKVLVDPSHATGQRELIAPLSLTSLAAGADGVLVESHFDPQRALSDADQALDHGQLHELIEKLSLLAPSFSKEVLS